MSEHVNGKDELKKSEKKLPTLREKIERDRKERRKRIDEAKESAEEFLKKLDEL
ncbi:hypothetical protein bcgnr5378_37740 [Bacillus cereus]|uniref:Uncharacterized protein n=1 Tax=Bacillus cereus TaxID=1396 RepID=A0A164QMA0_BACCE|nr:hypothetical protein [Bacillus cereus]KZD71896.1 hypothetical protein B4088_0357 [Bacillus cereus]